MATRRAVVDDPDLVRRQAVPLGAGAKRRLVVVAGMVILLATGAVPAVVAGLLAAGALVLLGSSRMPQAYRSISWTTIVLVGGMTPLSAAMQQTGAAQKLADRLVRLVGDSGPYMLLAGLFLLTAVLGQLISNMATALIVIPIAVSAAVEIDVSARPVLMAVNVAAAACVPHAGGHTGEPDGDGSRWVPVRRLLEARRLHDAALRRGVDLLRAADLVVLTAPRRDQPLGNRPRVRCGP